MAANLSREAKRDHSEKVILVEHDIAYVPYLRHYRVAHESGHLPRILKAWWHYRGIRIAELSTLKRFKRIVAMSPLDAATLSGLAPNATILTVPNGVDTEAIKPNRTAKPEQELVYVGGLSHRPNFDAIQHYQRDILPVLRTSMPEIRLSVLGETGRRDKTFAALKPIGYSLRAGYRTPCHTMSDAWPWSFPSAWEAAPGSKYWMPLPRARPWCRPGSEQKD